MDRRSFLKGLLATTALVALPLPLAFAKGGVVKTFPYVIVGGGPLCEFGGMPVPRIIGEFLGSQLFPEGNMISRPRSIDMKGPQLKRNKDGTLWTRLENRPEEGLHP